MGLPRPIHYILLHSRGLNANQRGNFTYLHEGHRTFGDWNLAMVFNKVRSNRFVLAYDE